MINYSKREFDKRKFPKSRFGDIHPDVLNWRTRVLSGGGAHVSQKTLYALDWFYKELKKTGLYSKMVGVNCFVPDNLIASITPLIRKAGNSPWTNTAFTVADLNKDGLKGDATSKYLNTGIIPAQHLSVGSAGISVYCTTNISEDRAECAVRVTSPVGEFGFQGLRRANGRSFFVCFQQDGNGSINPVNTDSTGYFSGNRVSPTSFSLYSAKPKFRHTVMGHVAASSGTIPNFPIFVFNANLDGTPQAAIYSSQRLSFVGIHFGLTFVESSLFFNLIHSLRVKLGGGFVT